ncbi:Disease resistance RPP13-like protein 4 [Zea mays]|uniref:Disease resistance RPP13-like protein 4 n=1 Tax=Zea mays TaxID=4577 RepID=A0A3L6G899_MAIZE|nr:Disease resistance RPP13-like protein 4 [Zea mays]
MAELAAGAVGSLLGVIRNEMSLLGSVRGDVQFIKEEMESMNSFLLHLARTAPPGGEHDEQVRTWMNQVRMLAQDCNNCLDLYLYRGNPDIHRARGGVRRYLWCWWVPWFLQKLVGQHRAAVQLGLLKLRARDVGERRLRYGVEIPGKSSPPVAGAAAATPPPLPSSSSWDSVQAAAPAPDGYDDEEDGDPQLAVAAMATADRNAFIEACTLVDYFQAKLVEWVESLQIGASETFSISVLVPEREPQHMMADAIALAQEALIFPSAGGFLDNLGYNRAVLIDIPAVHLDMLPLGPNEALYYILRQLKLESQSHPQDKSGQGEDVNDGLDSWQVYCRKLGIYHEKKLMLREIKEKIKEMKIDDKLDKIKSAIRDRRSKGAHLQQLLQLELQQKKDVEQLDLDLLLHLLLQSQSASSAQDQRKDDEGMDKLPEWDDKVIAKIARKLKKHMEATGEEEAKELNKEQQTGTEEEQEGNRQVARQQQHIAPICLPEDQYKQILLEVFPKAGSSEQQRDRPAVKQEATEATALTTVGNHAVTTSELGPNGKAVFETTVDQKMAKIKQKLKERLKSYALATKIKEHLNYVCPLIILIVNEKMDGSTWTETRNALSLLACGTDAIIVTTTRSAQWAKEYCYPQWEPIEYSLAGRYYSTVLQLARYQKDEDGDKLRTIHKILEECEPDELCMKIFTRALYANPSRSNEELTKLHTTLQEASRKSSASVAKKMFKFSYNDLPKEYKSCLLYLAIFPLGHEIRRSTLVGRWVVEGLITKEDWPSSVREANRCFDVLISRCLVYPVDTSATGKVKSCMAGAPVHQIITKIARNQHILETRLSHHLARYFSIFNDLRLRGSETISTFFQDLSKSSQVSLLKVLDLEGCGCFGGRDEHYFVVVCRKMLLLKYLSLRRTNLQKLPSEINNLHELEVLDLRQTSVPASATKHVLLHKLKRLLGGSTSSATSSSVLIPHKIEKMTNMEVLSNVRALASHDLTDIGRLCQLRKLGVVIGDKENHLKELLRSISDLQESLQSLSITLPTTVCEGTPAKELPDGIQSLLKYPPKLLESLSISGTTQIGRLLPLFSQHRGGAKLAKVTLSNTCLNQDDLKLLADLPRLLSIKLQHVECTPSILTFSVEKFTTLKRLSVEGSNLTEITFEYGAIRELEKIVLTSTNIGSIHRSWNHFKLDEVELDKSSSRLVPLFDAHKLTLRGALLEQGDLETMANCRNMRSLVLKSCGISQNKITFKKDGFPKLNLLAVDCPTVTDIVFTGGSAPKLEKIIWSSPTSLSGIHELPRLKEVEFSGDTFPDAVKEAIEKHRNNPTRRHIKPEIQVPAEEGKRGDDNGAARFSFCWK